MDGTDCEKTFGLDVKRESQRNPTISEWWLGKVTFTAFVYSDCNFFSAFLPCIPQ